MSPYPPIADYALIGDCHSAALVSRAGSVDWCCLPRFDSDPCFGRLLDWQRGGCFVIAPVDADCRSSRAYLPGTLVLQTTFSSASGEARLTDLFAMRQGGRLYPRRRLLRIVEGVRGCLRLQVRFAPRFDFGEVKPWIRSHGLLQHCAVGSNKGLVLAGDVPLQLHGAHDLAAQFDVGAGERHRLALQFVEPEHALLALDEAFEPACIDRHLQETIAWWHGWSAKLRYPDAAGPAVQRSAIVLKALEYAPTGAIIAAPTTSLPERIGGERNWDYRFSWIRDSLFTVHALAALGCESEADGFRRFIERTTAGNADELQVLYGVDGKRRLTEVLLPALEGYRGSRPVRIGNDAEKQFQADMYGMLLEQTWRWRQRGMTCEPHYWQFLVRIVDVAATRWSEPDRGIWEVRGEPRHHVHSKVMCWAALDRGIALAQLDSMPAPLERWQQQRDALRAEIEARGYDAQRGVYLQHYGGSGLDAALLLLPEVRFVDWRDPRMLRTAEAIRVDLSEQGLVLRYRSDDGMPGSEGAFIACSFWLVACLAHQGRHQEAQALFERASACANDLGLYPEEFDTAGQQMAGNFPQGLTHLAHIAAAMALAGAAAPNEQKPLAAAG